MEPFASLDELKQRLDWELDADEERIAEAALEDASDMARYHGRDWTKEAAPRLVRTLVLKACVRYMRNPEGYTQSRAGDETLTWSDLGEEGGTVHFTRPEIELLRSLSGKTSGGFVSAGMTAWGPQRHWHRKMLPGPGEPGQASYVPTKDGAPVPLFASPDDVW